VLFAVLLFVLVRECKPLAFAAQVKDAQNRKKFFKINGFMRVASDGVKGLENAKSAILSPVRLPFRRSGRRAPLGGTRGLQVQDARRRPFRDDEGFGQGKLPLSVISVSSCSKFRKT
jgi:hypothetical protein